MNWEARTEHRESAKIWEEICEIKCAAHLGRFMTREQICETKCEAHLGRFITREEICEVKCEAHLGRFMTRDSRDILLQSTQLVYNGQRC